MMRILSGVAVATVLLIATACTEQPTSGSKETPPEAGTGLTLTPELLEAAYVWGLPIVAMYRYYQLMGTGAGGHQPGHPQPCAFQNPASFPVAPSEIASTRSAGSI